MTTVLRVFLLFTAWLALAAAAATWAAAPAAAPNLVLIMADDMGFSDLGCYGSEIQTPNLDRLAADGLRFTQFYNNAKCTTTRASLLSGMYPRNNGNAIPRDLPTIAETLRAAGYQTGMSGKWHLGSKAPQRPIDRGFDEYYGLMDGAVNFFNPAKQWQLYDVVADRTETKDLAATQPARVKTMSAAYLVWAKALGRRLPGEKGRKSDD